MSSNQPLWYHIPRDHFNESIAFAYTTPLFFLKQHTLQYNAAKVTTKSTATATARTLDASLSLGNTDSSSSFSPTMDGVAEMGENVVRATMGFKVGYFVGDTVGP